MEFEREMRKKENEIEELRQKEEMEFERKLRKKEIEELRQKTFQLRLKLAEAEARVLQGRDWRAEFSYLSSKKRVIDMCSDSRTFISNFDGRLGTFVMKV